MALAIVTINSSSRGRKMKTIFTGRSDHLTVKRAYRGTKKAFEILSYRILLTDKQRTDGSFIFSSFIYKKKLIFETKENNITVDLSLFHGRRHYMLK